MSTMVLVEYETLVLSQMDSLQKNMLFFLSV